MKSLTLDQAKDAAWDVIIIGAGMGGGFLGRRLAEQGRSVLFVERGPAGHEMEQQPTQTEATDPFARHLRSVWPKQTESRMNGVSTRFFGPYGIGIGGSSTYYAAALERPERHDIDDHPDLPHPTGGWPVNFDAFTSYFDEATAMLHLCGTVDPLSSESPPDLAAPMPISENDDAMIAEIQQRGLHPYRLHLGVRTPQTCNGCFGRKCPWNCKMDGRSAGVMPALATGQADIITDCKVTNIQDDGSRVTGIQVLQNEQSAILTARSYALCAGSLGSPLLLLSSTTKDPRGCANSSGWVGRGLMFHLNEMFVLWPRGRKVDDDGFGKAISLRDLYSQDGERFGLVQSVGLDVTYGNMVSYLNTIFNQSILRRFEGLRGLTRLPALALSKFLGKGGVFVGMMEDYPYPENRVVVNEEDPDVLTFEYIYHAELLARRKKFRKALLRAFRGHKRFMISVQPVLNFGHPVGTLRFGNHPATSVLRPDCRTHDLDNLFVADGSFMPSAMGVNPSLTIAANALRVGDVIANKLSETEGSKHDVET